MQKDPLRKWSKRTVGRTRFAVVGDAGTGDAIQYQIARQLVRTHAKSPFASLLLLGDNVYEHGETTNFDRSIAKPYGPLLRKDVRVFGVLGNHDVHTTDGKQQLQYLGLGKQRWYQHQIVDNEVEIFAIDTTLLVSDTERLTADNDPQHTAMAAQQDAWLRDAMAKSTAKYKIVMGHHPVFASGTAQFEREALRPLEKTLVAGGASLYIAGHQHVYERRVPKRGVTHIISGGGGRKPHDHINRGRIPEVHHKENHFMTFELTPQGLSFATVNVEGKQIDGGVITAKQK